MSALPPNQSLILGGGYSPWQASLAALFSGISAAGQPGGWANFGTGVQQGAQNFQTNLLAQEQAQRARDQFQIQKSQWEAEQRRANQEDAERQAKIDAIHQFFRSQSPQMQTAGMSGPIPPDARRTAAMFNIAPGVAKRGLEPDGTIDLSKVGDSGLTGADTTTPNNNDPNAGRAQSLILGGMTPQQSQLFSTYAQVDPVAAFDKMVELGLAQPKAPSLQTFIEGDQQYQGYLGPDNQPVHVTPNSPRWQAPQGPGLTERQRNALAAGLKPGTNEYQQFILGRDDNEGGGPFEGNGMDQQATNILLTGDPSSPEYAAAYAIMSQPKVQMDPTTGRLVTVTPNMSWAAAPRTANAPQGHSARPMQSAAPPLSLNSLPGRDGTETMQLPGATVTSRPGTTISPADRTKLRTVRAEAVSIRDALTRFKDVVKSSNWMDDVSAATGGLTAGGRRLNSAWTNAAIMSKAEALFNLGVLNGPDLTVIQGTLPNPSTLSGLGTTEEAYSAAVDEVLRLIDSKVAAYEQQFGDGGAPEQQPPAPAGGRRVDSLPDDGNW